MSKTAALSGTTLRAARATVSDRRMKEANRRTIEKGKKTKSFSQKIPGNEIVANASSRKVKPPPTENNSYNQQRERGKTSIRKERKKGGSKQLSSKGDVSIGSRRRKRKEHTLRKCAPGKENNWKKKKNYCSLEEPTHGKKRIAAED